MLVPVYGFLEGDVIGLLLLVKDQDRVATLVTKLQESASVRVAPRPGMSVVHRGKHLDPALRIAEAGIEALDRIDVRGPDGF